MTAQKIIPHLWFDTQAKEAAAFYASVFPNSSYKHLTTLKGTPSGDCDVMTMDLWGHKFMAISAGPYFKPNPSINFFVNFDPLLFGSGEAGKKAAREKLDQVWDKLSEGGKALMPIDKYFFSERYGWIQDKYGFSWQLMLTNPTGEPRPTIVPSLMFVGANAGKAEEAINFYLSVFKNSKMGNAHRYSNQPPDKDGTFAYADFVLENQWFAALDSAHKHEFTFNEAVSLMVLCEDQGEIDSYSKQLSAVPEAEQCGWIKDRYGVSWQISPKEMNEMMANATPEQLVRLAQSFLKMKRFNLAELRRVYGQA